MQAQAYPSWNDLDEESLHDMARYVVGDVYEKTLRGMEDDLTIENYFGQMARIERYKEIHKNRI